MSFLEKQPIASVAGIATLGAAGSAGFFFASQRGALDSWNLPYLEPWQALTLAAYGVNAIVIGATGPKRLDGPDPENEKLPRRRFFFPAPWAFGIWGPIFMGEAALVLYQATLLGNFIPGLEVDTVSDSAGWLAALSPWLASAFLCQSLWCFTFLPWARDAGVLWFAGVLLGATSAFLGGAHNILREVFAAGDLSTLQYWIIHVPISVHFAWVACASLLCFNNYVALLKLSDNGNLGFSIISIFVALGLGGAVTGVTGDPIFAVVIAWALTGVAAEGGWERMKGKVDSSTLETQALFAKIGAAVSAVIAGVAYAAPHLLKKAKEE